jgi:ABC-type transport system substrate-binding protein
VSEGSSDHSSAVRRDDARWLLDRAQFLRHSAAVAVSSSGLAAVIAACGGDSNSTDGSPASGRAPAAPSKPTGTLETPIDTDVATLDPANTASSADYLVLLAATDALVDLVDESRSLAESHSVSDDGTTWTFRLRPDIVFHDGERLDSTAVLKNLRYWQTSKGIGAINVPAKFASADDSDPLVLRVVTDAPFPDFARNLGVVRIVSPSVIAQGKDVVSKKLVGTGPYRFVRFQPGRGATLEAFERYWGKGPYFERVEVPVVGAKSAQLTALQSGQLHLVDRVPPPRVKSLERDPRLKVESIQSTINGLMVTRVDTKPTDDRRVRQAIAHAIDRESILEGVLAGLGIVVDNAQPKEIYGYTEVETKYPYDPERARALLKDAGHADGVDITFVGASNVHIQGEQIRQAISGQLEEVGIRARTVTLPDAAFGKRVTSPNGTNIWYSDHGWTSPTLLWGLMPLLTGFQGIVKDYEKAITTADGSARLEALAAIQNTVADEMIYWPVVRHRISTGMSNNIYGYEPPSDGFYADHRTTYSA